MSREARALKQTEQVFDPGTPRRKPAAKPREKKPATTDPIAEFKDAMLAAGVPLPDEIIGDGEMHVFDTKTKKNAAGWYILHLDHVPAGAFGDCAQDISEKWCAKVENDLTDAEREENRKRWEAAQRERQAQDQRRRAAAATRAAADWKRAAAAPADHPYLVKKGIKAHGAKVLEGDLLIPLVDAKGKMHTHQRISPSGEKRLLYGGAKAGHFFCVGGSGPICIAEGYATACSILEATGCKVFVAIDAGNLLAAAQALRKAHPRAQMTICGDDDAETPLNPGRTKALEAAQAVGAAVAFPDFGTEHAGKETTDFNDLHRVRGLEAVAACIKAAQPQAEETKPQDTSSKGWPELVPLPGRDQSVPKAFPFDGLGPLLGDAAKIIAREVQAPDAIAGGGVLAASALAAQAHADVVLPHGQVAPLSLYILTAANSGDRKTAVDNVACLPAEEVKREQARKYAREFEQYKRDCAARKRGDPEIEPPVGQSLTIGKNTVEGLHRILRTQSHIGVFTGEGAELLGGHSMREDRRAAGIAWLLKGWDGATFDTLTSGEGLSVLIGRRVSIHALLQPILMHALLADPLAKGQGFTARCLISEPATLAGTRMYRDSNPREDLAVKGFHEALRRLLARPSRVWEEGDGFELHNRQIGLSDEAKALWVEFFNLVEIQQANDKSLQAARAFASKAAEHAARIAGVIEIVNNPDALRISGATMMGAIEVASFYITEHVRLTGASLENLHAERLSVLLAWILKEKADKGVVKHKVLLQYVTNSIRELKAEGIKPLLDELSKMGHIRRKDDLWETRPGSRP